ncbi:nucleoside hydrolase [Parapusillimonas sp. SGNA-6]|uniref:nucleoside hydrolase n=1 Tax=Parapedobacter sp. SGR-10 TaxID=2710879 RepID=UPI0013D451A4|nr:nucleoside hydrolase [Parapedobacter sp. SGR-10]NGF56003.1 nucleoside hydrolase [Parapedobacter sp. SGR-10]NGM90506.1 nucleoside hydrolase [Parapusillimonas sp. SGNA-6]
MKNIVLAVFILLGQVVLGQQHAHPFYTEGRLNVILDTDMGNDIDDALALDMLYKYADQNRIHLLAIMNNKESDYSTRFIDMMSTWYGYKKIPIGRIEKGVFINDYVDYSKNMVEYNDTAKLYKYSLKKHDKLLPAHELYRKVLAKEQDYSVVVISVGFSTNLARLLESGPDRYSPLSGAELVAKKVKYLSVMAGSFGEKKRAEFNVIHDRPAAQYVIANWPTGIVLSPFEVGAKVIYPSKSIEQDFGWAVNHPLVDAYRRYRPFPYNRPTWDLTSVYYTVEQQGNLLNISKPGKLTVDEKGFTHFSEQADGKHYVLSITEGNARLLKDYFVDLIKQKPKRYRK